MALNLRVVLAGHLLGVVMLHFRAAGRRQRRAFIALCVGLSAIAAATTEVRADASVVIDAAQTQSDCGANCDDLLTLQNLFQDANAPAEGMIPGAPWYGPVSQLITDLKMKRVRLLQDDVYCDVDNNGQFGYTFNNTFTQGDCEPLGWALQWAFSNHLSPHVAVASFMPPSFTGYGAAETWPPAQLTRFKTYAYQLVNNIVRQSISAGVPSVVFEVSNEIDIADNAPQNVSWNSTAQTWDVSKATLAPLGPYGRWLWWIDPTSYDIHQWPANLASSYPYPATGLAYPYIADVRRLDHGYSPVYQIFSEPVAQVTSEISSQYPNFQITIAGPTTANASFLWNPSHNPPLPTLEEDFLDQILNPNDPTRNGQFNSPRFDRYAFHYYGNAILPPTPLPLETITTTVQKKLQSLGKSQITLFMSEWGPAGYETDDVNYSHKGAAWAASLLPEAVKAGVTMGSYLILEDGYGYSSVTSPGGSDRGQASLLGKVIASDGTVSYYPKPAANVFKMYTMMTGARRPATVSAIGSSSTNLGAFAASDTSSAHILVYNYNPQLVFNNPKNTDSPENVSVTINNLPFNGNVTVTRYLVDSATSNFEAFLADPTKNPVLQNVETFTAMVQNGQLSLTPHNASGLPSALGLGVTYWRVTVGP